MGPLDAARSLEWLWTGYAVLLNVTLFLAGTAGLAWLARRSTPDVQARLWTLAVLGTGAVVLICTPWYGSGRELAPTALHAPVLSGGLATPMIALTSTLTAARVAEAAPDVMLGVRSQAWAAALCLLWLTGVLLVLARLAWGWWTVARLSNGAREVDDARWRAQLEEARSDLGAGPASLRRHGRAGTPLTWGVLRPTVLLPAGADEWPAAHRRAVLLHELEHVRRRDCLVQVVSQVVCALLWFHPLIWYAAHRLAASREEACDAAVVRAGLRPSTYAECLMRISDLARLDGAAAAVAVSAGMARPTRLQGRVRRILQPEDERLRVSRLALRGIAVAAIALLVLAGSLRLNPRHSVLREALLAESWATRAQAVLYLAHSDRPEDASRVSAALAEDPDPRVRIAAELLINRPH